jgi:hypothetical protein
MQREFGQRRRPPVEWLSATLASGARHWQAQQRSNEGRSSDQRHDSLRTGAASIEVRRGRRGWLRQADDRRR